MLNHGVITWGNHVEDAYWRMENTEALCRTVWVASQLNGGKLLTMTGKQERDLIDIRKSLGMDDKRDNLKECQLCDNDDFRPGVVCDVPQVAAPSGTQLNPEAEALVKKLTDEIVSKMS